jgi:hypothetical protein
VTHQMIFGAKMCPSSCENADEVTAIFQPRGLEHDLVLPLCSGCMFAFNSSLSTLYQWIFDQTGEQPDSFREKPSLGWILPIGRAKCSWNNITIHE